MFSFSDLPISRGRNLGVSKGEEVGADFFIQVDTEDLPMEKVKKMTLKRGQAEFHDAYILHHSPENHSDRYIMSSHPLVFILSMVSSCPQIAQLQLFLQRIKNCQIIHVFE